MAEARRFSLRTQPMAENKAPVDTSTGLVTLNCQHVQSFRPAPPSPGEQVYCRTCQDYRHVIAVAAQISVRCMDCKYSRRMGVGGDSTLTMTDALAAGGRHVMKAAEHRVTVTDSDGNVRVISNDGQGELPMVGLRDERNANLGAHAGGLRNVFKGSESVAAPRSDDG